MVTNQIIEQLEKVDPNDYKKPWFNVGFSPFNAISKKPYQGINNLTLGMNPEFTSAFASFKQWTSKGCKIRPKSKSSTAVFWKISDYEDEETGKTKKSFLLRYYPVFNSTQVEGDFARQIETERTEQLKNHDSIHCADTVVKNYLDREQIPIKPSDVACYVQSKGSDIERIEMPLIGQFQEATQYYSVFFHEMGHSTGNKKRLDRDMSGGFGSQKYAQEELVAELSSAFLSSAIGMEQSPRPDHAAYIKSWLTALKNDPKFIFSAASKAQKAADFILGVNQDIQTKQNETQLETMEV